MRVMVTGSSGFIGSAVVAELLRHGHSVAAFVRSDEGADRVRTLGAEPVIGDLGDVDLLGRIADGADGVVHLAYEHGSDDAVAADERAITAMGDALADSGRPLVVTSGTLALAPGRIGVETDAGDPGGAGSGRLAGEQAAARAADRGVRAVVVRLAPCVHDTVRRGFAGALIDTAERTGFSAYVGDGQQRWPAVHRLDAAVLFRLALESAAAGTRVHGVGEQGVRLRELAELIGRRTSMPVRSIDAAAAADHFGWIGSLVATDAPASSELTRELLDWQPTHRGLLEDVEDGDFFAAADA